MSIDRDTILRRKAARAEAVALAELVRDTLDAAKFPDSRDIICTEVRKVVGPGSVGTTPVPIRPMSNTQSRAFDQEAMPYGKYKGHPVGNIPLDYLCWLADDRDAFVADLRRYCLSRRVQDEQESPESAH